MGYETRNWFEVLNALGAYPAVTPNIERNDNTEVISRTTGYLACLFPNGAVSIAPHLTRLEEDWPGGFSRDREQDAAIEKQLDLPTRKIRLESFQVNGHCVDYKGFGAVAFAMDEHGYLIAFAGHDCSGITIDGRKFVFADKPLGQIGWAPVQENRQVENGARLMVFCNTAGSVNIPVADYSEITAFYAEGSTPGQKGEFVPCKRDADRLVIDITGNAVSRWLYGVSGE